MPEALSFGFEALVKDTPLDSLAFEIEFRPRKNRCSACGFSFAVVNCETACPRCGDEKTLPISGDELDIAYIEVEES